MSDASFMKLALRLARRGLADPAAQLRLGEAKLVRRELDNGDHVGLSVAHQMSCSVESSRLLLSHSG